MYQIPKEVSAEIKFFKGIYLQDLFFLGAAFLSTMLTSSVVHSSFRVGYYFFCGFLALWLFPTSKNNPGARNWRAYIFWLIADFKPYNANIFDGLNEKERNKESEDDSI